MRDAKYWRTNSYARQASRFYKTMAMLAMNPGERKCQSADPHKLTVKVSSKAMHVSSALTMLRHHRSNQTAQLKILRQKSMIGHVTRTPSEDKTQCCDINPEALRQKSRIGHIIRALPRQTSVVYAPLQRMAIAEK